MVKKKLQVAPVTEKIKESRLRWFGHVMRRPENHVVKKCLSMAAAKGGRGRPVTTWLTNVRRDMKELGLSSDDAYQRTNKIKFTMELEKDCSLPFLDVLVKRNPDNTLGRTVYRKPTHTDRYLNGKSHHHPSQLVTVGKSLFQRAQRICDDQHLAAELQHARRALQANELRIPRVNQRSHIKIPTVERRPAILPFVRGVTDRISHILKRASIKTYFKPMKKMSQFLRPVKCNTPLQTAGVYRLDCECGLSYVGQTKRSISTRVKEHIADVKHRRPRSAVCEHVMDKANHSIKFDKPLVLAKEKRYIPRMLREAIEIKKYPNFNREDGFSLPPAWDPVGG
ncbi:uncharacterized protein LOC134749665 [Cydia strobilella]|uniref:uncharacterized protein LOC134749665 n=1 Tax=Cydia strobilella TaxID=1100964 RepID=UPI003006A184